LLLRETKYIQDISPEYNILQQGNNPMYNNYTEETIQKMKENDFKERKDFIIKLNSDKKFSADRRQLLSKIETLQNSNKELKDKLNKLASKPVSLYNKDNTIYLSFPGIRAMAKYFNCCNKTINNAIKNQSIFRGIGIIKLS